MNDENDIVNQIIEGQAKADEEIDYEFLQDFIVETNEHIDIIQMNVLNLENDPEDDENINSMFREFHTIKGLAGFVNQMLVQDIAHQTETLLDRCRKGKIKAGKDIVDLILTSTDYIKRLCNDTSLAGEQEFSDQVSQHLMHIENYGVNVEEQLKQLIKPDMDLHDGDTTKEVQYDKNTIIPKQRQPDKQSLGIDGYMRIHTYKVDNLMDMVGELIIMQSLVEQEAALRFESNDTFISNLLRTNRIIRDIQNLSMSLRMVSLKSTFQKIKRIARDTIAELGKDVNFDIRGEETEIDRSVADKLLDPLVHLVKNAIAHGIEDPEERVEKNKPSSGFVEIEAYSRRGNVYIEISDDGRGLCKDTICSKAIEKNLINSSVNYSESEILEFIFLPGFSTIKAKEINNISGRGVGLDVVKTEISKIGGKIEINNRQGNGCTFILKIPINLAVMDGTIINIFGSSYIIPTLNVKQILQPKEEQWVSLKGQKRMIRVRDDIISVVPVSKIFSNKNTVIKDDPGLIVILELDQKLIAMPIHNIIGKREIVVKPLGEEFVNLNFISGASILGDGKVSLIIDIESLFKTEEVI